MPIVQRLVDADEARANALAEADRAERQLEALDNMSRIYLDHVARLEASATEMKGALSSIHRMLPELSQFVVAMTGQNNEPLFNRPNCDARLLNRMAEILADDIQPLAPHRAVGQDAAKWVTSWADEEGRGIRALMNGFTSQLKARIGELRASAAE